MEKNKIQDNSGDAKMLWETIGKPAYEKGLLEGRQEAGLFAVIPMAILENKTLSANAKLLYGEIMALSKKSGICFATNEYMAEMLGLSKASIPQLLRELSGCGLVLVDIKRSKKGTYRNITVSFFNQGGHCSSTRGGMAKEQGGALLDNKDKGEIDKIEIDSKIAKRGFAGNEINKILSFFKEVNPSYERLYANKTQRAAVERLIGKFGEEKIIATIQSLPALVNKPFAPKITTPLELERDLGKLIIFYNQEKSKVVKNKYVKIL